MLSRSTACLMIYILPATSSRRENWQILYLLYCSGYFSVHNVTPTWFHAWLIINEIWHLSQVETSNKTGLLYEVSVVWTRGKSVILIYFDGFAQNCSNSIANALELLQSCARLSIWWPNLQPQTWSLGMALYHVSLQVKFTVWYVI